ncbi:MAG: RNA polymerase sigma factor RpoH [Magnetococcales bacterium]|nr:RNA polymerase sigma factor RpoH [Magnetococcales bacterium]PPR19601.1 MAG: RNA polymerase sigma factor RpoH [Pseudomonadota bacterium]|tara:strand:+ start:149 stop:1003 length:855 start_codon:yes stop_codon:yes gene_type:complete
MSKFENIDNRNILQQYLNSIQHYQTLSFEEEQELARKWKNTGNRNAAHKLVNAHLRLVVKVALGFKGYGLPVSEIIQEGNIGLMQAIKRFDPNKGFRLSTYAMWWIRASIQEYVLNSWSLVKIGTTAAQKKLFFNLRKIRNKLNEMSDEQLSLNAVDHIAKELDVKPEEVEQMNLRMMSSDQSLNAFINDENGGEWQDWLIEESDNQEEVYGHKETTIIRRKSLQEALERLDERERKILIARRLTEKEQTPTLEDLSLKFGISRERVRQLEVRAFNKVKKLMAA